VERFGAMAVPVARNLDMHCEIMVDLQTTSSAATPLHGLLMAERLRNGVSRTKST